LALSHEQRISFIEKGNAAISLGRQVELLGISRSSLYYKPVVDAYNLKLMKLLDEQYTKTPFYGSRKFAKWLARNGYSANRKRVQGLLRAMGLAAIYPKPRLSLGVRNATKYPYLLSGVVIERVNQVWATDITYIRMSRGWGYLAAILDWRSRYVLAWRLSADLEVGFCLEALEEALGTGKPEIFNSDQGVQFTSTIFTGTLKARDIAISMDGRGRVFDNIFTERLWRTVKYEEVYLHDYESLIDARQCLGRYFEFYNRERLHAALAYKTPWEVYGQVIEGV
jgi:putative transposase